MTSSRISRSARRRRARALTRLTASLLLLFTLLVPLATQGLPAEAETPQAPPLTPGSTAMVRTDDGACLRLREGPALTAARINCIPDGRTVLVLPATEAGPNYRWQLVEWRGESGWAADRYLRPYDGPPLADSCQAQDVAPGITGQIPAGGGFGLVVWGGGTLAGLETTALVEGCRLTSVFAARPGGGFVAYRFGAPDFVNQEWRDTVGSVLAAGTPLLITCDPPGSSITARTVPLPAATAPPPILTGTQQPPDFEARAAVVVDEASGTVLYQHNAYEPLPLASLTKIATAILALEGAPVDAWVPVSDVDYRRMPGSSVMGLTPGDCFLLRDLIYGLMLPSGNDAALAIARFQAGSDGAFVDQMNTLTAKLGLTATAFIDPHGLGGEKHRASAYDIAMLSRYAMTQHPLFRTIVNTTTWTAVGDRELSMYNVNSFLSRVEDADGVKTGYTEEAGRTLSASVTRNGHRLYVVILNDDHRYATAGALLDWAFENHTWQ